MFNIQKQARALVFSPVSLWDVHHADTIELLYRLDSENKQTFLINCFGDLSSCAPNSTHSKEKCDQCIKISNYSGINLYPKKTVQIKLEIPNEKLNAKSFSPKQFFDLKYESLPVGRLVASQIADDLGSYYFYYKWEEDEKRAKQHAANCIGLYSFFKKIICTYKIDEVYAWNGRRPSDGPALYAAKHLNKKYFSFIVGSEPKTLFVSDATSVQDINKTNQNIKRIKKNFSDKTQKIAKEYLSLYSSGKLNQIGYVNYAGSKSLSLNLDKKNLLLVTSSPQESMHLEEVKNFFGLYPFEKIFSFIDQEKITNKYNVTVRWHPRIARSKGLDSEVIHRLAKNNPNINHIFPESNVKTELLLPQADVVTGTNSTLCLLAVTLGKPVILFGPWVSYFGNSVYSVSTPHELSALLEKDLSPKPSNDAYALAYYRSSFGDPNRNVFFTEKKGKRMFYLAKSLFRKIPIHPEQLEIKSKFPFLVRIKTFLKKLTSRKILN